MTLPGQKLELRLLSEADIQPPGTE